MEGLRELDRIGSLIAGKYRLELILGRGGMGTVYRAVHTWTGRSVAVKCLHPEHAHDAQSVSRFLREARAAAAVRHPNAVDVLDMGQDTDGSAYLVLELLEGDTLAGLLSARKPLAVDETVAYLVPVLEALEELHRAGVVHRDLKPANVFLARAPKGAILPKLLDFGVAKVLEDSGGLVTTTGIVVGTPAYMAPEQAAGNGHMGPWTDIWAAGVVLYECLTGELPFMAPTASLMLVDVMTKEPPRLSTKRPDLPPALCAVVDRALSREGEQRFSSAAALVQALCAATGVEAPSHVVVPAASSRSPAAFAETEAALPTPVPPGGRSRSGERVTPSEPPATGLTATGRLRAPRPRRALAYGLVAVVAVMAALLLALRGAREEPATAATEPVRPVATEVQPSRPAPPSEPEVTQQAVAPEPQLPTLAPLPDAPAPARQGLTAGASAVPQVEPKPSSASAARPRRTSAPATRPAAPPAAMRASPATSAAAPAVPDEPRGPRIEREW